MQSFQAFTTAFKNHFNKLISNVTIIYEDKQFQTVALWDTGATISCVSTETAQALQLEQTGKMLIHTPSGQKEVYTYVVDVELPNHVKIDGVQVCDSEIGRQGLGMIVGMDIIGQGDFAVTNFEGTTTFTFRYPSKTHIDFVKQLQLENARYGRPNRRH